MSTVNRVNQSISGPRRIGMQFLGGFFLLAAIIGVFVPIWPTTCFLLFALGCFARSSPRMHDWMLGNRYFGRHLRQYQENGVVEGRVLAASLLALWSSLPLSLFLVAPPGWVTLLILGVGAAVTIHLLALKSSSSRPASEPAASFD